MVPTKPELPMDSPDLEVSSNAGPVEIDTFYGHTVVVEIARR